MSNKVDRFKFLFERADTNLTFHIKGYVSDGGMAPHVPKSGIRWKLVVTFMAEPLYPRWKSFPKSNKQEDALAPDAVWTLWKRRF